MMPIAGPTLARGGDLGGGGYGTAGSQENGVSGPPSAWDAGYVAFRLISAYRVILAMPARLGPQDYGAAWPDVILEFSDLVEGSRTAPPMRRTSWSAANLAMAEEALSWPLAYLAEMPHRAEAVTLWAYAKASRRSLRRLLQRRKGKPYRVRSDTTLRRYLKPGLEVIAAHLRQAEIPVR